MTSQNVQKIEDPNPKEKPMRQIGTCIVRAIVAVAAVGAVFWLLWNWAAVPLFTFPVLTYVQALTAILLTGFLVRMGMCAAGRNRRLRWHAGCEPNRFHNA